MPETTASVKEVQTALNRFTTKYLRKVPPLVVDGKKGKATNTRIMTAKYFLGYGSDRDSKVTKTFLQRMGSPHNRQLFTKGMYSTSFNRRTRQRARGMSESFKATVAPNVTRFDGVPCAIWIAKELARIRAAGRWKGKLVSGWRSPAYSKSLCMNMCGAPSCPGRCAGTASNHAGSVKPAGACDVSDYTVFEAEAARLKSPLINRLDARDPVHFSISGR